MREASSETNPVNHQWRLLVRLIFRTFKDGLVPEELAWAKMVLFLKGKAEYQVIGLVEVV